jgi:hypothetical protein
VLKVNKISQSFTVWLKLLEMQQLELQEQLLILDIVQTRCKLVKPEKL